MHHLRSSLLAQRSNTSTCSYALVILIVKNITAEVQVFISKCLRKILKIFCPYHVTNKELWKCTKQHRIDLQMRKCKYVWLGHTLWKPSDDIARQTLEWNPQGKQGRGRPRNRWWRTVLEEAKGVKKIWAEIKTDTKNQVRWGIPVEALCSVAEWWDLSSLYYMLENELKIHSKADVPPSNQQSAEIVHQHRLQWTSIDQNWLAR